MKKWVQKIIKRWAAKKFPRRFTTKVRTYDTVYVKKGKIREWRTFDLTGNRMHNVIR